VRAFPLTGEGGWPQARRMRVKPKGCAVSQIYIIQRNGREQSLPFFV